MKFELPKLPYSFDALEPHIDKATMEVHYTKHHQTYLDKFLQVIEKYPELDNMDAEEMLTNLNDLKVEEADRIKIQNHGGGYINHNLYWSIMAPNKEIDEILVDEIKDVFGSTEEFKEKFNQTALNHFGSGWAWLVRDENDNLKVYSLPNQNSPYTLHHTPILTIDMWEHAHYLKFQNRKNEYIDAWWNVVKLI